MSGVMVFVLFEFMKNKYYCSGIQQSSHEDMFGTEPKFEYSTSSLSKSTMKKLKTEEARIQQ